MVENGLWNAPHFLEQKQNAPDKLSVKPLRMGECPPYGHLHDNNGRCNHPVPRAAVGHGRYQFRVLYFFHAPLQNGRP